MLKPFASGHRLNQAVPEQRTVDQPGQMIILGEIREALFRALSLDRVAHRAGQELRMALAFDEVILGALLHRLKCQRLITHATQHDDRNRRVGGMDLADRR